MKTERTLRPCRARLRRSSLGVLAALILAAAPSSAAPNRLRLHQFQTRDGLSQNQVNAIVQDRQGFLWLGTQDGLNRFDGYEFEVLRHDADDPDSMSGGEIYALTRGDGDEIWVGTDQGLNRLDGRTRQFTRFVHDPSDYRSLSDDRVLTIARDDRGAIWVGTAAGLNRFEPETGTFHRVLHRPEEPTSLAHNHVRDLAFDAEGALWVATDGGGLDRLDPVTDEAHHFRHREDDPASLSSDRVRSVFVDSRGTVWAGTYESGLNQLVDAERGVFARHPRLPAAGADRPVTVRDIFEDETGRLWAGTDAGVWLWEPERNTLREYRHSDSDPDSLGDDRVKVLYQDASGLLWVGTEGGLDRWNPASAFFSQYDSNTVGPGRLSNDAVMSLFEGPSGDVWIGTYDGLNHYDPERDSWTIYRAVADDPTSLSDSRVTALLVDFVGDLWVGTRGGGVNRLRRGATEFEHYRHDPGDPDSLSADGITVLQEDITQPGKIWVGSFGGGLDLLDAETGRVVRFADDAGGGVGISRRVISLAQERGPQAKATSSVLWIGTYQDGLYRLDRATGSVTRHQPEAETPGLAGETVFALHIDRRGDLWIGYQEHGLDRWRSTDRLRNARRLDHYGLQAGLPNDTVYAILEDAAGNLWFSTNNGLARLDPETGEIRVFDESHGLQGNEFNHGAAHRGRGGTMYFGGSNGFNSFDSGNLPINETPPPVHLTAFFKLNERVPVPLDVEGNSEIVLDHRDYVVSFEFAALDYAAPENNRYAAQLEGLDEELVDLGNLRRVTYTNLEPGPYTLRVLAANNDGVWNEEGFAVHLRVLPAPWATWWAYTAYFLIALTLLGAYVRSVARKLKRESEYARKLEHEVGERTREVEESNRELRRAMEMLKRASVTDPLTGLHNRRFLKELMRHDSALVLRRSGEGHLGETAGIQRVFLMIDLDGLKEINDTHGHAAGDAAILAMRDLLLETCRSSDTVVRLGGDEFLVVGRDAEAEAASSLAERLRRRVASYRLRFEDVELRLSCSIGFSFFPFLVDVPGRLSWERCMTLADRALYASKASGRNTWVGLVGESHPSDQGSSGDPFKDVVGLVESGAIRVLTSLPDPSRVSWRSNVSSRDLTAVA